MPGKFMDDVIVFSEFDGMSTQSVRQDLNPKKAAWMENLQPIGANNILCTPAANAASVTFGKTISKEFYFNCENGIDYQITFFTDGSAEAIPNPFTIGIFIAGPGTFSTDPDITSWGNERILIADSVAGYSTWAPLDSTHGVFVEYGGVSPNIIVINGGSYGGVPTVSITGGSGSGATAIAHVTDGVVTSIELTNAGTGYVAGDVLTVSFSGGSPAATSSIVGVIITSPGSGYSTNVTVTFSGGGGSGATGSPFGGAVSGTIGGVNIITGGSDYTTAPTVTFADSGGGTGATGTAELSNTATATAVVWPNAPNPKPITLAVAFGRVWLAQSSVLIYTGTTGYDDFDPANASGSLTIQDADLTRNITALRNLNNYLFIFGDASVKQIGNISVSGTITNFTITTLSSDQGTTFRDSIASYNRLVVFSNTVGVYAVFGSSVEKISDDMDGIYRLIDFTQFPSAAVNDINNIHCYLLLVKYNDPVTGPRALILAFMNKKWFVISQGSGLKFIYTAVVNGVFQTFGTSGLDTTQLLANPNAPVAIKLSTSLTSHGNPVIGKRMGRYVVAQTVGGSATMTLLLESERAPNQTISYNLSNILNFEGNNNEAIQFVAAGSANLNFVVQAAGFHYRHGNSGGVGGIYLGATLTGSVQDFTLNSIMLEYGEAAPFGSEMVAIGATP